MARTLSRLLWWKLVGNLSKRFASGRSTSAWHSGQRNFPFLWLISACFFIHSKQNVCRQVIVLGSVKVSRQIEQVTCSLRFFSRDSIVEASFTATGTHPILCQSDSGKLGPYTVLPELRKQVYIALQAANQIWIVLPSDLRIIREVLTSFKWSFKLFSVFCKISRLWGAISSLVFWVFNNSLLNLAVLLILRRSFQ